MTINALAKLTCLFTPDPTIAEVELTHLKYSKAEIRSAIAILKGLASLQETSPPQLLLRLQYFLFQNVGTLFPAVAACTGVRTLSRQFIPSD